MPTELRTASCDFEPYLCHHHHGDWKSATLIVLPRDAISAAAVLANQLPRGVNRAKALLPSTDTVNMPSRMRSATVTPAIRLPQAWADCEVHTPHRLERVPSAKRAIRAVRSDPPCRASLPASHISELRCVRGPSISDRSGRLTHRLPPKPKRRMLTTPDPSGQHQFIMQREETQHEQA
jgi:hypothetical protein